MARARAFAHHRVLKPMLNNDRRRSSVHMPTSSPTHFLTLEVFAAPESGLPFLSIALASQSAFASFVHLAMNEVLAAPASALPFLSTALVMHVSAEATDSAAIEATSAMTITFMKASLNFALCGVITP